MEELRGYKGYYSILLTSYFMWSSALDSSGFLLSYTLVSLSSHMTNILITTLKHINIFILMYSVILLQCRGKYVTGASADSYPSVDIVLHTSATNARPQGDGVSHLR